MLTAATGSKSNLQQERQARSVQPSIVDPVTAKPFTLDQELKTFGRWTGDPIWVPPKDTSRELAKTMLEQSGLLTERRRSWSAVVKSHRDSFTQVREIELKKASIRLPKGRLFVSVTRQENFDQITDDVPDCVQTRLEEFLAGPGRKTGVRVSYLKPICVEVNDELHFTDRKDIMAAIELIQNEVFAEYRRLYLPTRAKAVIIGGVNALTAVPRGLLRSAADRRMRAIDTYHARLELQRRKIAWRAAKAHRKRNRNGATFDEMLALTNPLERTDVVRQYGIEQEFSKLAQQALIRQAAGHSVPWFAAASLALALTSMAQVTVTAAPAVAVCDPVFVAEFPSSPRVLMNIGHFDEIAGVRHVEF